MDSSHKLKIKIGQHEFEAEGTAEAVQQQFEAFKELMATASSNLSPGQGQAAPQPATNLQAEVTATLSSNASPLPLSKIMRVEGRVVSLTVPPDDPDDAVLLILYGQRVLRQNDSVTGAEVMDGMTSTGGFSIARVDKLLASLAVLGEVIVIGEHRAKRYRLTNTGNIRATKCAEGLIAKLP